MSAGNNGNNPPKGSVIKVEPIRGIKAISAIKEMLKDQYSYRDYAMFVIGINTNLRASDLLKLKIHNVKNVKPMEQITLREQKTGKLRTITVNNVCYEAIQLLIRELGNVPSDSYLFLSRKRCLDKPMHVSTCNAMVKRWCDEVGLEGNFGSHTLRKTWGYHQYKTYGVDLPRLMVCFNHSSELQTLTYLCITREDINRVYANTI